MDFLLRHMNARGFFLAGAAAAAFAAVVRFHGAVDGWYEDRHFAGERGAPPPAADIASDLDRRQSLRLRGLYRDVSAEIAAAKARGMTVAGLQSAADAALGLDAPATRTLAIENLNRLRLAIPQPLDAVRPATAADDPSDAPASPKSSPARRGARAP